METKLSKVCFNWSLKNCGFKSKDKHRHNYYGLSSTPRNHTVTQDLIDLVHKEKDKDLAKL